MKYILASGIMAYSLATVEARPAMEAMKQEMESMQMADMDVQNWMQKGMEMDLPWMDGKMDMEAFANMDMQMMMQPQEREQQEQEMEAPAMADVVEQLMQDQQMREIIQKWKDNTWDAEEKEYTESDSDSDNYGNVVVTRVDNSVVYIKPIINNNNAVITNENEGNTNINNNNMLVMFDGEGAKKIDWEMLMEAMEEWEMSSAMKTPTQPMTSTGTADEESEASEASYPSPATPEEETSEFDFSEEPISVWSPDTPTWTVDTPPVRETPSISCVSCLFEDEEQAVEEEPVLVEVTEGEIEVSEEEIEVSEEVTEVQDEIDEVQDLF